MTSQQSRRRAPTRADRQAWSFIELHHDTGHELLANLLVSGALEQARLEQQAREQHVREAEHADQDETAQEIAHA